VRPVRIGIVGCGKIAREAHVPALSSDPAFELAAVAGPHAGLPGVATFPSLEVMLDALPQLEALAICTPPQVRYELARVALSRGKHVLLEKPPCPSVAALEHLASLAQAAGRTLYQSWHSQHARAVPLAARELAGRRLQRVRIRWKEDVRQWHPGQHWLWEPGGFGVFDPGINALSILTRLLEEPLLARAARLHVPANCATPIAAELSLQTASGVPIEAELDFRTPGMPCWEIEFHSDRGVLTLAEGGASLRRESGDAVSPEADLGGEYTATYRRFAELLASGRSEVDSAPLRCVADLHLLATRIPTDAFTG